MGRGAGFKSWAERRKIVDEAYSVGNTVSGVARKHGIGRRLIHDWRAKLDKLNDQGEMNPVDWKVKGRKKTLQPPQRRKDAHALFSILNDLDELRSKSIAVKVSMLIPRYLANILTVS